MKNFILIALLFSVALSGCVSKSKSKAKARAAFFAGQQQGAAMQNTGNSVWVVGNVRMPLIPWTEDLTLTKALIAAEYLGAGDPSQIVLLRTGQPTVFISPKQLLNGFDLPLLAGDRIEIRP
jgi:hypothetical protein